MTERPIIFTGESVRAILNDAKTQSRRVCRPSVLAILGAHGEPGDRLCPYGAPGDRLWVKETWAPVWAHSDGPSSDDMTEYRADTAAARPGAPEGARWLSPIYMPRRRQLPHCETKRRPSQTWSGWSAL